MQNQNIHHCSHCGWGLEEKNCSIELGLAHCPRCKLVTHLDLGSSSSAAVALERLPPAWWRQQPVERPSAFQVERHQGGLSLRWSWRTGQSGLSLLGCLVGDGAMLIAAHAVLNSGASPGEKALGLTLLVVGAWVSNYPVWVRLLNATRIEVGQGQLRVNHGPLPWKHALDLRPGDFEQFFVQARSTPGADKVVRYELCGLDRLGRTHVLLDDFETPSPALYLEQELEEYLGIAQRRAA
jgi:hypothetical protein